MRLEAADSRWAGCRVVVAAPGPSLDDAIAAACRREIVLAVNDAYQLMPFAQVLYACDGAWWRARDFCRDFAGERWSSHHVGGNDKRGLNPPVPMRFIAGVERDGFSRNPAIIRYGNNSGFQAINLAILFGADPIVLVGFDMRAVDGKRHFFGNHKLPLSDHSPFATWITRFERAANALGPAPRIVNATPGSALTAFPMIPLAEALGQPAPRGVPAMAASDPKWGCALVQYR